MSIRNTVTNEKIFITWSSIYAHYLRFQESERQHLIRRVASDTTTEEKSRRKLNDQPNTNSFLQVPNIVNLHPESRYQTEQDSFAGPSIRVTPPSLHSSMSMSNVSTVVAQIETNIPTELSDTISQNISISKAKDNLDVRIDSVDTVDEE